MALHVPAKLRVLLAWFTLLPLTAADISAYQTTGVSERSQPTDTGSSSIFSCLNSGGGSSSSSRLRLVKNGTSVETWLSAGDVEVRERQHRQRSRSLHSTEEEQGAEEEEGPEDWLRVKEDLFKIVQEKRGNECAALKGQYESDNARVFCEGNLEIIGFPCLDCPAKFEWRDVESIRRCQQDPNCVKAGFRRATARFGGALDKEGEVPILAAGQRFSNFGGVLDSSTFTYSQREETQLTVQITSGYTMGTNFQAEFTLPGVSLEAGVSMEGSLSRSTSKQTVLSTQWTTAVTTNLPPHSDTRLECFIWANRYSGEFGFSYKPRGPVLIVVWNNKKGKPQYTYFNPEEPQGRIEHWLPDGYAYKALVQGLKGVALDCNKTVTLHENGTTIPKEVTLGTVRQHSAPASKGQQLSATESGL